MCLEKRTAFAVHQWRYVLWELHAPFRPSRITSTPFIMGERAGWIQLQADRKGHGALFASRGPDSYFGPSAQIDGPVTLPGIYRADTMLEDGMFLACSDKGKLSCPAFRYVGDGMKVGQTCPLFWFGTGIQGIRPAAQVFFNLRNGGWSGSSSRCIFLAVTEQVAEAVDRA